MDTTTKLELVAETISQNMDWHINTHWFAEVLDIDHFNIEVKKLTTKGIYLNLMWEKNVEQCIDWQFIAYLQLYTGDIRAVSIAQSHASLFMSVQVCVSPCQFVPHSVGMIVGR